ncbi:MAG TPA: hypothetical protein VGL84_10255 [Gaiellaceae bacterium]
MRFFVSIAVAAAGVATALSLSAGAAVAMTPPVESAPPAPKAPTPPPVLFVPPPPAQQPSSPAKPPGGSTGSQPTLPSGCRDIDIVTSERSFLFQSNIYRFHQLKHWCWRRGAVVDERHAWSFDGGSTACFDTVYPDNHWTFSWHGVQTGGDFSEERAHVTNCVFHIGDWKEYYPDVKIWAYADGTYKVETAN